MDLKLYLAEDNVYNYIYVYDSSKDEDHNIIPIDHDLSAAEIRDLVLRDPAELIAEAEAAGWKWESEKDVRERLVWCRPVNKEDYEENEEGESDQKAK